MKHIFTALSLLLVCLLFTACTGDKQDIQADIPADDSSAHNVPPSPPADEKDTSTDEQNTAPAPSDTTPDESEDSVPFPAVITVYHVPAQGSDGITDVIYVTDTASRQWMYDAFKPENLAASAAGFADFDSVYYIDFGNGYALSLRQSTYVTTGTNANREGSSIALAGTDNTVYSVDEDDFERLQKMFVKEPLPAPSKVTFYDSVFTTFSEGKTGWAPSKTIEITDPAQVEWWYNALSRESLTPDGTVACRCGPAYYIDFGNGYALLAHSHNNAYRIGTRVITGGTMPILADTETNAVYSLNPDAHQKLKDLFK